MAVDYIVRFFKSNKKPKAEMVSSGKSVTSIADSSENFICQPWIAVKWFGLTDALGQNNNFGPASTSFQWFTLHAC